MLSGRGTDRRLEQSSRARAAERLAARVERRRSRSDEELLDGGPVQDGPAQDGPAQDEA
jgi:GTP-binding protein